MFFDTANNKGNNKEWLLIPFGFLISIIILFLNSLGWLNGIKLATSYILDPIYVTSSNLAGGVERFFTTLVSISDFRSEYNEMKLQIAEYEVDNLAYQTLENENLDLKTQLELGNKEYKYIQGKVLNHIQKDYIIINTGTRDGVNKGDIAVLGESLLGIIIEVNQYTSKVRLPISKSNFLEGYVLSSEEEVDQRVLSRAVISGSSDGIRIENIGMNSGVENGDIVIVNDSKVGENLILGTVVGLSEDPATTTRNGYVSPAVDYYDLVNVFVRIDNVD
jgi:cell shape-determining protein MreC